MMHDGAPTALVVSGGVAANGGGARGPDGGRAAAAGLPLIAPPVRLCTDNAVMVAWAASSGCGPG